MLTQTRELKNEKEIGDCLQQLIVEMDSAIVQAIENPLLFLDGPFLSAIESRCESLAAIEDRGAMMISSSAAHSLVAGPGLRKDTAAGHVSSETGLIGLVWEVRARAGRLQRLLDSASQFYSTCFSPSGSECLDYGVHGEWGQSANPSHLAIDC
jgi:hypothetical protein